MLQCDSDETEKVCYYSFLLSIAAEWYGDSLTWLETVESQCICTAKLSPVVFSFVKYKIMKLNLLHLSILITIEQKEAYCRK